MPVEVTARHMEATDALLVYAREKGEEILGAFPRVEHVHVILNVEKKRQIAEMVVQAKNHIRLESSETTANMKTSIDGVHDKVAKQLRRQRQKVQENHRTAKKFVEKRRNNGEEPVS
jgi:putative sigma-54 modulation protein